MKYVQIKQVFMSFHFLRLQAKNEMGEDDKKLKGVKYILSLFYLFEF